MAHSMHGEKERYESYCAECGHSKSGHNGYDGECNQCQMDWFLNHNVDVCYSFMQKHHQPTHDLHPVETVGQFEYYVWAPKLGGAFPNYGDGYRRASTRHYKNSSTDELRADIGCLRHHHLERCDCTKTPCHICGKDKYDNMAMCGACWYTGRELPQRSGANGGGI